MSYPLKRYFKELGKQAKKDRKEFSELWLDWIAFGADNAVGLMIGAFHWRTLARYKLHLGKNDEDSFFAEK